MKKLLAIALAITFGFGLHYSLVESGIIDQVMAMVNQENGWKKDANGYSKTEVKIRLYLHASFLKDPEVKEFKIYQGAMKKEAVDRMNLVDTRIVEFDMSVKEENIRKSLESLAATMKCNTVIINSKNHATTFISK